MLSHPRAAAPNSVRGYVGTRHDERLGGFRYVSGSSRYLSAISRLNAAARSRAPGGSSIFGLRAPTENPSHELVDVADAIHDFHSAIVAPLDVTVGQYARLRWPLSQCAARTRRARRGRGPPAKTPLIERAANSSIRKSDGRTNVDASTLNVAHAVDGEGPLVPAAAVVADAVHASAINDESVRFDGADAGLTVLVPVRKSHRPRSSFGRRQATRKRDRRARRVRSPAGGTPPAIAVATCASALRPAVPTSFIGCLIDRGTDGAADART